MNSPPLPGVAGALAGAMPDERVLLRGQAHGDPGVLTAVSTKCVPVGVHVNSICRSRCQSHAGRPRPRLQLPSRVDCGRWLTGIRRLASSTDVAGAVGRGARGE